MVLSHLIIGRWVGDRLIRVHKRVLVGSESNTVASTSRLYTTVTLLEPNELLSLIADRGILL